jgi:hypothetical protein
MGLKTGGTHKKLQKAMREAKAATALSQFEDAKAEFEKSKDIEKKAQAKVKMLQAHKEALKAGVRAALPFGV